MELLPLRGWTRAQWIRYVLPRIAAAWYTVTVRFVILGTGAVGGVFGAKLAKAAEDVFLLARGAGLAAMRRDGLRIEGKETFTVRPPVSDRPSDAQRADLLIVSVKAYDTERALRPCLDILGPDSGVLTLQNGLGNVERIASIVGAERVIPGVAYVASAVTSPGVVRWDAAGRIQVGPSRWSEAIRSAFEGAGCGCEIVADPDQAIWEKLVANAVFNVMAAVNDCSLGDLLAEPRREECERAIDELAAVAATQGIVVRPSARESCWTFCRDYPAFRTSTQQDRDRGAPLEAEALSGELIRRARAAGIPVPTHEKLYARLSAVATGGPR